jgi:hypothetical protein
MASGRLGALKPSAGTWKTLYKPSGVVAVVSVSICNQATSDDAFWIAVAQSASTDPTPSTTEYVAGGSSGSLIKAVGDATFADRAMFGPYELNSANNDQIVVKSNGGNVSFVVTGDEGQA